MSYFNRKKYLRYAILLLIAIVVIWVFQLEDQHELKSWIKAFIRNIS